MSSNSYRSAAQLPTCFKSCLPCCHSRTLLHVPVPPPSAPAAKAIPPFQHPSQPSATSLRPCCPNPPFLLPNPSVPAAHPSYQGPSQQQPTAASVSLPAAYHCPPSPHPRAQAASTAWPEGTKPIKAHLVSLLPTLLVALLRDLPATLPPSGPEPPAQHGQPRPSLPTAHPSFQGLSQQQVTVALLCHCCPPSHLQGPSRQRSMARTALPTAHPSFQGRGR